MRLSIIRQVAYEYASQYVICVYNGACVYDATAQIAYKYATQLIIWVNT